MTTTRKHMFLSSPNCSHSQSIRGIESFDFQRSRNYLDKRLHDKQLSKSASIIEDIRYKGGI